MTTEINDDNAFEQLKDEFNARASFEIEPEKYVLQTLDDAALVLTVCRMSLMQIKDPLPSLVNEVMARFTKVSELMKAIDTDVAQWYTTVEADNVQEIKYIDAPKD